MTIKATELRARQALGNATAQPDATADATNAQPKRLKALAEGVLGRNRQRNQSAADGVEARNFSASEDRRQCVLHLLAKHPEARYAALAETQADPQTVLLTLAIRGQATCEFQIPLEKWDGVLFLELLERHSGTIH